MTSKPLKSDLPNQDSLERFEISREKVFRQHLKPGDYLKYFVLNYIAYVMGGLVIGAILLPSLALPFAVLFAISFLMSLSVKKYMGWEICSPVYLIPKDKEPKKSNPEKDRGLLYLGNDKANNKALWFGLSELKTHIALWGTTGAGKTEFLLGLMYQLMVLNSGFIFVDGKASITTWASLYSNAKKLGLEDNVLVVNFFTGGKSSVDENNKISNTFNPFAYGSSDTLMEILSGMMGPSSNDSSMWRGRAEALGRCLLRALCELRDKGSLELSVETIREFMALDKIKALSNYPELSKTAKGSIQNYLNDLPGWTISQTSPDEEQRLKAELEAGRQHNYLTMQFTHILEILVNTYAHITKTDLSEVDFMDVIINRRFLYIMLPSLEKSPESLKNLGRMLVTCMRNALSRLLGIETLTGEREKLIDNKSFNAKVPFGMFFDEYGSYSVEGFADIAAQARTLNIMQVFSGQDYASFKQGSEIEAQRILSNTGIKIFMKIECGQTAKLAVERGCNAYTYLADQIKRKPEGDINQYRDTGQGKLQEFNRINPSDLYDQGPGECHITYGDKLWRADGFYGDFKFGEYFRINQFIKLRNPEDRKAISSIEQYSILGASSAIKQEEEMEPKIKKVSKAKTREKNNKKLKNDSMKAKPH